MSTGQYVVFQLRGKEFAIQISKTREVLDVGTLTKVPGMPDFISGVINLRGDVVPVMDLGQKLEMKPIVKTKNTSIIILELQDQNSTMLIGVLADAVLSVVLLSEENIEPAPRMGPDMETRFIAGIGRPGDEKLLFILDMEELLDTEELSICEHGAIWEKLEMWYLPLATS